MAATYEPIATTTLGSATSGVTFNSIPSTYTDLILITNAKNDNNGGIKIRFNNDSGSNYSYTRIQGDGSSPSSDRTTNSDGIEFGYLIAGNWAMNIIQIQNYSNSTTYKTLINEAKCGNANPNATVFVELWRSTSAINKIQIDNSQQFQTGSTFTLYGVKSA